MISSKIMSLNLSPNTPKRFMWEKTPFPVTFKAYLFNITNPLEFVAGGKPNVQEIGPYVFDEWKSKIILSEDNDEDSVTFEMMNTFFFRPDLSQGLTGDEMVTIPHLLLMGGLISTQRDKPALLDIVFEGSKQLFKPEGTPFVTAKAMDLLFNGVEVDCDIEETAAGIICSMLGTNKGIQQINETYFAFSLLGGKNATSLGKLKINRGIKNVFDIGKVMSYDDSNSSKAFSGICSEIGGTDGSVFAPFHSKKDSYFSFSPGLCRTMEFKYEADSVVNGIPTSVYSTVFGDEKHCFCRQNDPAKCPPKGTFYNYACVGSPFIISKPHFLDADKSLKKNIGGLNPNKEHHDSHLKFELQTSTTLSIRNRNQFSMQIERIEKFDLMANITPVIMPIFWVEDAVDLPPQATNPIKSGIYLFYYKMSKILDIQSEEALFIGAGALISAGYACALINFVRRAFSNRIPKRWRKVGEVSDLICYPIKSCRWVRVDSFDCTQIGIEKNSMRDRVFMVVRPNGNFVTAVAYPTLFEVLPTFKDDIMTLSAPNMEDIEIDVSKLYENPSTKAVVWTQTVDVIDVGDEVAKWLSRFILKEDFGLRLVYYSKTYPTRSVREKNTVFETAIAADTGALHNTTSYMLINEASVADLGLKIDKTLLPVQFRPNIVVKGPNAFDEDSWKWIKIGDHTIFRNVKPCGRCPLINVDPETAQKDPEQTPLKTLKKYRLFPKTGESPVMGIHLGVRKYGPLKLGDSVYVEAD
ncbi:sensory neuron membrane protein 1-like [Chironomus tepperi]|uniref:sensory neuron membrane protein 1-like n=1 Tax=Chironomus tepperi TaxID=113505 RepID=UPI00391F1C22